MWYISHPSSSSRHGPILIPWIDYRFLRLLGNYPTWNTEAPNSERDWEKIRVLIIWPSRVFSTDPTVTLNVWILVRNICSYWVHY